jgi:uncharacterized iron-regulated membrane protein
LLFFIFLTGTLGYVNYEIDRWMKPELPLASVPPPITELLPLAIDYLSVHGSGAESWQISFPGGRASSGFEVRWRAYPKEGSSRGKRSHEILNVKTGIPVDDINVRETGGGQLLYRLHYRLHYMPTVVAYWLVGIAAMFMLMAIISGIIIHKKIFKDLFTFRPKKGQRSWLDGHNVLSVTALPFHLMITYSGLVYLMFTYLPLGPDIIYGPENRDLFFEEAFDGDAPPLNNDLSFADPKLILPMLADAERHWGENNISFISVDNPGQARSKVTIYPQESGIIERFADNLVFRGDTGEQISGDGSEYAVLTNGVLVGLHEGLFAGPFLRVLFVLSGLAGTAMIGTGLLLWSTKRKMKLVKSGGGHLGVALVDRLNLGTIVGLPIAIAVYFWANRIIPVGIEGRLEWEVNALFIAWACMVVYPAWRPLERAWVEMLYLAAGAYGFLPLVNLFTSDRHLGVTLLHGDWVLAGFDLTTILIAACFAAVALKKHATAKSRLSPPVKKRATADIAVSAVPSTSILSNQRK